MALRELNQAHDVFDADRHGSMLGVKGAVVKKGADGILNPAIPMIDWVFVRRLRGRQVGVGF